MSELLTFMHLGFRHIVDTEALDQLPREQRFGSEKTATSWLRLSISIS